MSEPVILRGVVTTGVGGHAHWMVKYADLYRSATGLHLFPGSLNLRLSEPWHAPQRALRLEPPEYGVGMSLVPCEIGGINAFILRTDKNDAGEGDHPPTVVEVAAAVRLRDALGLDDGDIAEVVVR